GPHHRLVGYQRVLHVAADDLFGIGVRAIRDTVSRPARHLCFAQLDFCAERKIVRRDHHLYVMRNRLLYFGFSRLQGGVHHYRSEEHTSELQSLTNLVCRLLLEKKQKQNQWNVRMLVDARAKEAPAV